MCNKASASGWGGRPDRPARFCSRLLSRHSDTEQKARQEFLGNWWEIDVLCRERQEWREKVITKATKERVQMNKSRLIKCELSVGRWRRRRREAKPAFLRFLRLSEGKPRASRENGFVRCLESPKDDSKANHRCRDWTGLDAVDAHRTGLSDLGSD